MDGSIDLESEEVARDDHEVRRGPQAVVDRPFERAGKVCSPLGQPVLAEAQVDVREMYEVDWSVAHGRQSWTRVGALLIPYKKRTTRQAYARIVRARGPIPCT